MIRRHELDAVASEYAQFIAENSWWTKREGERLHEDSAGRDLTARLSERHIIYEEGGRWSAFGFGNIGDAGENAGGAPNIGGQPWNACEFHSSAWTPQHRSTWLGREGQYRTVYVGSACYLIAASKTVGCVQDYVMFP
jgi:hypothetical protein